MQVDVHEAKPLSGLVEAALAGEEVVLSRDGVPVAKLIPLTAPKGKRILGQARGQVRMAADFDRPMDSDDLDEFLGL